MHKSTKGFRATGTLAGMAVLGALLAPPADAQVRLAQADGYCVMHPANDTPGHTLGRVVHFCPDTGASPEGIAHPEIVREAPPPLPPPPPPEPVTTFMVFFDFNRSDPTAETRSVIAEAVKTAKANGMVKVMITAHTDTVGSDSYNMGLSVRRAQTVKDAMVAQGMGGNTISIEGKGFHDPLVPTGPNVREPQNRRAVIDLGS
jgi:outer membrane protein OmpA-like peptidoglycan-associated protein